ncbi:MAG: hypothetical protein WA700_10935 [Acidobacteriaceae bacterium]
MALVQREHGIAVAVFEAGAPAPENRRNRFDRPALRNRIRKDRRSSLAACHARLSIEAVYYADLMADTQLQLNSIENVEGIPLQRTTFEQRLNAEIALDSETKMRVLARLNELARGSSLCHGDFHPEKHHPAGNQSNCSGLDRCKLRRRLW